MNAWRQLVMPSNNSYREIHCNNGEFITACIDAHLYSSLFQQQLDLWQRWQSEDSDADPLQVPYPRLSIRLGVKRKNPRRPHRQVKHLRSLSATIGQRRRANAQALQHHQLARAAIDHRCLELVSGPFVAYTMSGQAAEIFFNRDATVEAGWWLCTSYYNFPNL